MFWLLFIAFWGFIALNVAAEFRKISGKNIWEKIQNHGRMTRGRPDKRWYENREVRAYTFVSQAYRAQRTGQVRRGLKVHELKADNRAVCGNSRRQPMTDLGPGTVTCGSCALDTGH